MAIGFLIFGLLLISFAINLLGLVAFCVTPGLRTTGNRFVINLLITNLFGCFILAPTLFSNGNISAPVQSSSYNNLDIFSPPPPVGTASIDRLSVLRNQMMKESISDMIVNGSKYSETVFMCNLTYCEQLTLEKQFETILMTQDTQNIFNNVFVDPRNYYRKVEFCPRIRYWSMDLAAALGSLSVLLVVGDTWMAVRDPLRYHCRISKVKALVLITITWTVGLVFGVTSALVEINECTFLLGRIKRYIPSDEIIELGVTKRTIVSMIFACTYIIVIILMPFGFVCRMYWRIFSEAKENGLRIRRIRSAPLLRSTSNPTNIHQQGDLHLLVQSSFVSGKSTNDAFHIQSNQEYTETIAGDEKRTEQIQSPPLTALLPPMSNPNIDIKMNDLIRKLSILHKFPQDFKISHHLNGLRRTHSAPNLQMNDDDNFLPFLERTATLCSDQAVLIPIIYATPKNLNCIESIRRQILNASSIFKRREESRAARISILVVLMFLVSYLPYGLLVLLQGRLIKYFPQSMQLAVFLILLSNISSPLIFAFRNKRVRRGVYRIFGFDARSREHRLLKKGILFSYGTKTDMDANRNRSRIFTNSIRSCTFQTKISKIKKSIKFKTKHKTNHPKAEDNNGSQNPAIQTSIMYRNIVIDDTVSKTRPTREHGNCLILKICQSSPNLR